MATITITNTGGNWSSTATWSTGAVPTASDDIVATATSGNVTVDSSGVSCRSIDFTNYVGTFAMGGNTVNIGTSSVPSSNVALKCVSGMTITGTAYSAEFKFVSTVTGLTVTTAGRLSNNSIGLYFGGIGGGWTLQDTAAFGNWWVLAGTFNTNNQTITSSSLTCSGTSTRTLTLGSSAITLSGGSGGSMTFATSTGLTVTANTATITFNSSGAPAPNFGSVNFNGTSFIVTGSATVSTAGSGWTCANFSYTPASATTNLLSIGGSFTITGTFTATGSVAPSRAIIASYTTGSPVTITCNTTVSVTNMDFRDIHGAGTASWNLSATSAGDCQGNSGITFVAGQTNYYKASASANFSVAGNWYLATNGGGGAGRVPYPQDTAIFDANSGTSTYTIDCPRIGTLNCSGFTGTVTVGISNQCYGNLTWGAGMSINSSQTIALYGRGSQTITHNSKTYPSTYQLFAVGGNYTQQDNGDCNIFNFTAGTWNANGFNLKGAIFEAVNISASFPVVINMGSGTWNIKNGVSGQTIWGFATTTGLTINAQTSTIVCTLPLAGAGSWTFAGGGLTYNNLQWQTSSINYAQTLTITGSNTFNNITIQSYSTYTRTLTLTSNTTQTAASLNLVGASNTNQLVINAVTSGTAATFSVASGSVTGTYLSLQDNKATGGATFYIGLGSTVVSNVTGWNYGNPSTTQNMPMLGIG